MFITLTPVLVLHLAVLVGALEPCRNFDLTLEPCRCGDIDCDAKEKCKLPPHSKISFWSGKVNQHYEQGEWKTDPDKMSGADLDKLTYCRKWYGQVTSIRKTSTRETITFCQGGTMECTDKSTRDVYECVDVNGSVELCTVSNRKAGLCTNSKAGLCTASDTPPEDVPAPAPEDSNDASDSSSDSGSGSDSNKDDCRINCDVTKKISYYKGKVNQHYSKSHGEWQSDPDESSHGVSLTYCKKWYPSTTSMKKMKDQETINVCDIKHSMYTEYCSYQICDVYECVQGSTDDTQGVSTNTQDTRSKTTHTKSCGSGSNDGSNGDSNSTSSSSSSSSSSTRKEKKIMKISYWQGKVNQHYTGEWKTDPDGSSGAGIDKLVYCKKWYPCTKSYKKMPNQEKIIFCSRGNVGCTSSLRDVYECMESTDMSQTVILVAIIMPILCLCVFVGICGCCVTSANRKSEKTRRQQARRRRRRCVRRRLRGCSRP